jgi:hypothetical protein
VTTSGGGTLTLTGTSATAGGTWHLGHGTLALSPGARISVGSLLQSAGSTLSLNLGTARTSTPDPGGAVTPAEAPVEADGAVRLGGTLAITSAPRLAKGGQVTLIRDSANAAISGTFSGMPQGGKVTVDGRAYRIDYAADGGHDVVLASAVASAAGPRSAGSHIAAATDEKHGGGSTMIRVALAGAAALILTLLIGAAFLVSGRKRWSSRRGSHGASPARPRQPASPGPHSGSTWAPAPPQPRNSRWASAGPGAPPPYANGFPAPGSASHDDADTEFMPRYGPRPPHRPAGQPQRDSHGSGGNGEYGDGHAGWAGQPRRPRK